MLVLVIGTGSAIIPSLMPRNQPIPVIDLFAGPGGLGEGFAALRRRNGNPLFKIRLSIEKDVPAHSTLELRSFFRQFSRGDVPREYYQLLRGEIECKELFRCYPVAAAAARTEAWHFELKPETAAQARTKIHEALGKTGQWVLIGGPPCQAYSLMGRSRNKGNKDYIPEKDEKQTLYVEYLQVIADRWPSVFVMENVKGLLSATLKHRHVFERIIQDLAAPYEALAREGRSIRKARLTHTYRLYSLNQSMDVNLLGEPELQDFVVRTERHGIPQARHRLIILGVRDDISRIPDRLDSATPVPAHAVFSGLPRLRSGLSRDDDSPEAWVQAIRAGLNRQWINRTDNSEDSHRLQKLLRNTIKSLKAPPADRGGEFLQCKPTLRFKPRWFFDPQLGGICNHSARGHMTDDLFRYLYAACFARVYGCSPDLQDFPRALLPEHKNVTDPSKAGYFADRFRVQLANRPATTVTSHIAKDGHYYIHPDPRQCRSLTVREAARLQTFPDNYFFCGNRTQQYTQVGNAVPPLLALQIAKIVHNLLK